MIQAAHTLKRLLLVLGDFAVFELALAATLFIRYESLRAPWQQHVIPFSLLGFLWIVGFYIAGLYDLGALRDPLKLFRTYLEGMLANLAVAIGFFYLIPVFGIAPRTNLVLYFALSLLFGYLWRLIFHQLIQERFSQASVLYIGPAEEAKHIHQLLDHSALGLRFAAGFATSGSPETALPIRWIEHLAGIKDLLEKEQVQMVILGIKLDEVPELRDTLYSILFQSILILDRAEIEELTTGRIPLSYISETWFLHNLNESNKTWYEAFKRFVDILLSIPLLIVTGLLYPFIALTIKLSSPGPVLFSQTRVGKAGALIRIWKFRSMHVNAEAHGPQFTSDAKTDPRLFSVGRSLRQLRLDELPQVWNVLKGDLSFIGPRPERPEFVAPLIAQMPFYALRHLARPGLTGWAQVRFLTPTAKLEDNLKKLQYDLYYIKHRSLLLDLAIMLKTIGVVIRRQGT